MLTPEQIAEGWVEHDGGGLPLGLEGRPGVMFRDGRIIEPGVRSAEHHLVGYWTHHFGPSEQIIAYRPEPRHD